MNPSTLKLHQLGQRLWLDNITRELLRNGTLARYIDELSVTGLTSNPTIFEHAIGSGTDYDDAIQKLAARGLSGEDLFFELALQDLTQAADLFRPVFDASGGADGWVSLEVSPLLADNTASSIETAAQLHLRAARPNFFIKIPGTPDGIPAIEQSIFDGVPINVTSLFSREHYVAAAEAYLRGIERRIEAGLDPRVESIASLFVSRWDVAVRQEVSPALHNRLGIAIAMRTYKAYRDLLASERWKKLARAGARPQRLLWASTGTKDPARPTRSTSRPSRHPTRSTRFRTRPCWPLPSTARSGRPCPSMAAIAKRCSRSSGAKASTPKRSPRDCSAKASRRSPSRGALWCRGSARRVCNGPSGLHERPRTA